MTAWHCDFPACGHVWYSAKEPLRCAKCKRKNWNKVKGEVVRAPKTRKRKPKAEPPILESKTIVEMSPASTATMEVVDGSITSVTILSKGTGYESPYAGPIPVVDIPVIIETTPVLPTIVRQPTAAKYREILKSLTNPDHKIGEKCPHGWANWLQCPKCNPKAAE